MEMKNVCIALSQGSDLETMETAASHVAASIKNGGLVIFNDTARQPVAMPVCIPTAELYPQYKGREEALGGWTGVENIKIINFDKCGGEIREDLLNQHMHPKTVEMMNDYIADFDGIDCVAIHVDRTENDGWFEYIVNKTMPRLAS